MTVSKRPFDGKPTTTTNPNKAVGEEMRLKAAYKAALECYFSVRWHHYSLSNRNGLA